MGTSVLAPIGTLKRVAETMYFVFGVVNGEAWPPAEFGISRISVVSKVERSMRATRGVLLPLMNSHRPSGTPFVCDSSGWCVSSHGTNPWLVSSIGFVSSLYPHPFSGFCEYTERNFSNRPDGRPYT